MRRALAACALPLGLACAPVGPDFVRPAVAVRPEWTDGDRPSFETSPAALAAWWRVLEDPVLDALITAAQQQNNNLEIAGLRVLESQAALRVAVGNLFPQSQAAIGSLSYSDTTRTLSATQYVIGASVSWEIDFWGRFRRAVEAADAQLLDSMASYDDFMVLLSAQVADVYTIVRATEEQIRLARESVAIQERGYEIVDVLFRNGETSELDPLQARTLLLSTEATIPGLEASLQQAKNALGVLLGSAVADVDAILQGEGKIPTVPETVAIGIPADLLRQRPDVRSAEMQALAQNALVGVAVADLYPSFRLDGFLGLSAAEAFSAEALAYSVGTSFLWPVLNYGRIRNTIRVEDARLQQALIAYRETVIQAAREAEDALAAHSGARAQNTILAESVRTAERSASLSLLRYREGFADYQRVLDAQQALFTQQQRYASNRGDVVRSLVALYRSLGGGWQVEGDVNYLDEETRRQMRERTNWGDLLEETQ